MYQILINIMCLVRISRVAYQSSHPLVIKITLSKKESKDEESVQSSTTPNPGYQWENDNFTIGHHKRETPGHHCSFFPAGDHKALINRRAPKSVPRQWFCYCWVIVYCCSHCFVGGLCLVLLVFNHLAEKERADFFTLIDLVMSCDC